MIFNGILIINPNIQIKSNNYKVKNQWMNEKGKKNTPKGFFLGKETLQGLSPRKISMFLVVLVLYLKICPHITPI